jgi:hypothetical protein
MILIEADDPYYSSVLQCEKEDGHEGRHEHKSKNGDVVISWGTTETYSPEDDAL